MSYKFFICKYFTKLPEHSSTEEGQYRESWRGVNDNFDKILLIEEHVNTEVNTTCVNLLGLFFKVWSL